MIATVALPRSVGGMELPVALFDMDCKLGVSRLEQEIVSRLRSIADERIRLESYRSTVSRITVYRPTDLVHFSLLLHSIHMDASSALCWECVSCRQAASYRD